MGLLLFFAALAVGISFTCSLLESVILSVTKTYIAVKVKEGKKYAFILSELKDQIDRPLAAILSLNTIANTVGATGVGAQVVHVYGDAYLAFASGLLTFIILIFSEIVPKTLGANYWKSFAPACAYLIRLLIVIAFPFVWISSDRSMVDMFRSSTTRKWFPSRQSIEAGWMEFSPRGFTTNSCFSIISVRVLSDKIIAIPPAPSGLTFSGDRRSRRFGQAMMECAF